MRYFITVIVVTAFALSCNNDFNLIADKEEIPVVFGFLSESDTAQYIRVERAFRDESTSAFELALIPDSLYYNDITVVITDLETNTDYNLQRVDGNLEGYVRDEGVFATMPNYLYKIKSEDIELVHGRSYRLSLLDANDQEFASSQTVLGQIPQMLNPEDEDDYAFSFTSPSLVKWREREDLVIYDVNFYFNIKERDNSSPTNEFVDKTLTWNLAKNVENFKYEFSGINFYNFLLAELDNSEFIDRRFVDFEAEVTGAGPELRDYLNVIQANTGITSSGELPTFSNIENGVGVFSTRSTATAVEVKLSQKTLDSLVNGGLTAPLNFQ